MKNKNGALVLVEEDDAQRKALAFKEGAGAGVKWENAKDPKSKLALRAVEEYNAMKRKRLEKEFKAKQEEAKKKQRQNRLNSEA